MSEWARRITSSAGSSASIEYILKTISVGGFTCNLGKALSTLCGLTRNIRLIGAFGLPTIQDIFQRQLVDRYHCLPFTVGNPGSTDAFEFTDGKIMMVNFENINRLDWKQILTHVGRDFLIEQFDVCPLWGIGYWAASPHMSEIFRNLQHSIFPNLSHSSRDKYLLLDLSDLQKKPKKSLLELGDLLVQFQNFVQVVLLLNDRELHDLGTVFSQKQTQMPLKLIHGIQESLGLTYIISHSPKVAILATEDHEIPVLNAYTSMPRFSTSAGDHFNAGIGYALLLHLPTTLLPLIGNCLTSYFVRNGTSPTASTLQQFLMQYKSLLPAEV